MSFLTEFCTRFVNFVEGIISLMNQIRKPRSIAACPASTRWLIRSKRHQVMSGAGKVVIQEQFISRYGWKQDCLIILHHVTTARRD